MKRFLALALALVLTVTACGGDGDADNGSGNGGDGNGGSQIDDAGFDTGFGSDDLPAGFPSQLVPPSFISGQFFELGESQSVLFRSEMSFDDAVDFYNGVMGVDGIVVGDGQERLASWTELIDGWGVGLIGTDPLEIGLSKLE